MRYDPKAIVRTGDIVPGTYSWVCVNAEERTSKTSGLPMLNMEFMLNIPGRDEPLKVFDNLPSHPKMLWKMEQFCKAVGIDFEGGLLQVENCIGREGVAEFDFGNPNNKGKTFLQAQRFLHDEELAEWNEKNGRMSERPPETKGREMPTGDDIPF